MIIYFILFMILMISLIKYFIKENFISKKIYVFGDSHSRIFNFINIDNINFKVNYYSAASINGLCKNNSTLNIKEKIINEITNNKNEID